MSSLPTYGHHPPYSDCQKRQVVGLLLLVSLLHGLLLWAVLQVQPKQPPAAVIYPATTANVTDVLHIDWLTAADSELSNQSSAALDTSIKDNNGEQIVTPSPSPSSAAAEPTKSVKPTELAVVESNRTDTPAVSSQQVQNQPNLVVSADRDGDQSFSVQPPSQSNLDASKPTTDSQESRSDRSTQPDSPTSPTATQSSAHSAAVAQADQRQADQGVSLLDINTDVVDDGEPFSNENRQRADIAAVTKEAAEAAAQKSDATDTDHSTDSDDTNVSKVTTASSITTNGQATAKTGMGSDASATVGRGQQALPFAYELQRQQHWGVMDAQNMGIQPSQNQQNQMVADRLRPVIISKEVAEYHLKDMPDAIIPSQLSEQGQQQWTVTVRFVVDETGQVMTDPAPQVMVSSGNDMIDTDAVTVIAQTHFHPFERDGRPSVATVELDVVYE